MPRRERYEPKHRAAAVAPTPTSTVAATPSPRGEPHSDRSWRRRAGRAVVLTGVAAAATGAVVSSGVVHGQQAAATTDPVAGASAGSSSVQSSSAQAASAQAASAQGTLALAGAEQPRRGTTVSRSLSRTSARVDTVKRATLTQRPGGARTHTENLATGDPRDIARALLPQFGFGSDQFSCLDSIYVNESGWNVHADNPSSSAYGIPQALPGSKMSTAGADWATNPATQIRWGLGYIKGRYGTPCSAWGFKQSHGWY